MRSGKQRIIILLMLFAVLAGFIGGYLIARAIVAPFSTITVVKTVAEVSKDRYWNATRDLLDYVMKWVEEDRGLEFDQSVKLVVLTKRWVVKHWGLGYINRTEVGIEEELYKALFMVPESYNLTRIKLEQSGCTVAASADNTIYVVREYFDPSKRLEAGRILAHELTHILQGTHFKIPRGRFHDERQAIRAVIEGDADQVALDYFLEHGGKVEGRGHEEEFDPVTSVWLFPYLYGREFVQYIRELGGWEKVNEVYLRMPGSTAEILHPEKYVNGWKPRRVEFATKVEEGWRIILRDRLGEFFLRQMLRAHLPIEVAVKAAEGWSGDLIEYYRRGDERLLRWKIVWEDDGEVEEFLAAFTQLLEEINAEKVSEGKWRWDGRIIHLRIENLSVILIENFRIKR
ncbi:MAG: hypothetical protein DRN68_04285 [Thaumarchaeota archaeon]|nr:MAG: hypothetical protein DRN68_04285 [Nitrososphaerota archaeon]